MNEDEMYLNAQKRTDLLSVEKDHTAKQDPRLASSLMLVLVHLVWSVKPQVGSFLGIEVIP
jgi:hypothetical protein